MPAFDIAIGTITVLLIGASIVLFVLATYHFVKEVGIEVLLKCLFVIFVIFVVIAVLFGAYLAVSIAIKALLHFLAAHMWVVWSFLGLVVLAIIGHFLPEEDSGGRGKTHLPPAVMGVGSDPGEIQARAETSVDIAKEEDRAVWKRLEEGDPLFFLARLKFFPYSGYKQYPDGRKLFEMKMRENEVKLWVMPDGRMLRYYKVPVERHKPVFINEGYQTGWTFRTEVVGSKWIGPEEVTLRADPHDSDYYHLWPKGKSFPPRDPILHRFFNWLDGLGTYDDYKEEEGHDLVGSILGWLSDEFDKSFPGI